MSSIRVKNVRAEVIVEPSPTSGNYDTASVEDLRGAVLRACRAMGNSAALDLARVLREHR